MDLMLLNCMCLSGDLHVFNAPQLHHMPASQITHIYDKSNVLLVVPYNQCWETKIAETLVH